MEAFDNESVQLIIRCKYERSNSIEISFTQVLIKDFMYNHYQRTLNEHLCIIIINEHQGLVN